METCQNIPKEKLASLSPEPFEEPEGMTTIDLNSGDYSAMKSDAKKEKPDKRLKHVQCILWLILFIFLAFLSLIIASLLNREYHFIKSKYVTSTYDTQTETNRHILTTEQFKKEIFKNNIIEDNKEMFELCKITRSIEDCCKVFTESKYEDLIEFCTVNEIVDLLLEYETKTRIKRQVYEYPGNDFLQPLKHIASNIQVVAPKILDKIKQIVSPHSYDEAGYDYNSEYTIEDEYEDEGYNENHRISYENRPEYHYENPEVFNNFQEEISPQEAFPIFNPQPQYQVPEHAYHDIIIRPQIAPTSNSEYKAGIQKPVSIIPAEAEFFQYPSENIPKPMTEITPSFIDYQHQYTTPNRVLDQANEYKATPPHQFFTSAMNSESQYQNSPKPPLNIENYPPPPSSSSIPVSSTPSQSQNQNFEATHQLSPNEHQNQLYAQYNENPANIEPSQPLENQQQLSPDQYRQIPPDIVQMQANGKELEETTISNICLNESCNLELTTSTKVSEIEMPTKEQKTTEPYLSTPFSNRPQLNVNQYSQTPFDTVQMQQGDEELEETTTISTVCLNENCNLQLTTSTNISRIFGSNETVEVDLNDTDITVTKGESEEIENSPEESTELFEVSLLGDDNESTTTRPRANDQQQQPANDFRSKIKAFPSEDVQINQQLQTSTQPCFYPYPYPQMMYPMFPPASFRANDGSQMLRIIPMPPQQPKAQQTMYVVNPPMYYGAPFQPNYPQNYPAAQPHNSYVQASGPGGQYYMCNPVPAPAANVAAISGVEIRREAFNLQDLMENYSLEKRRGGNRTRDSSIICPLGEFGCSDNTKCIKKYHVCDNEINCDDASDELFCTCKQRVGELRHCDGYCDCFDCEDEKGCFGCKEDEFSCDDWSRFKKSTCIPLEQRCDNIRQCEVTGKDEEDCSALADQIGNLPTNKVSNAVGFLHRNYKGKWYPTCFGTDLWALEVCSLDAGPSTIAPKSHMMLTTNKYDGTFINILPNDDIDLVNTCIQDRAAFVECPPLYCGIRMVIKNMYRPQEVDTSIEDDLNDLERSILRTELSLNNETVLGAGRVVGGKASQPASWPWLVTIYKNGVFHCGGVLISELWIVTAAHCVDRYWQYYYEIQAGVLRRFSYSPMEQSRWAVLVVPHESYDKVNLRNDIALIKLSAPLRYNRYVRPICLPSETTAGRDYLHGPTAGMVCTTVGWGATREHGADPDHMREVEIPILAHCRHQEDKDIDEICAGLHEGGKDACQGDSGGPLMCRNPNNPSQWYFAGIVSHGEGCARPSEPGVYTRVSRFVGWISENMRHNKFLPRIPLQKCPGYVCKATEKCLPKKRHCDRIVDCLLGDDEENCEVAFHHMFKHSRKNYYGILRESVNSTTESITTTEHTEVTTESEKTVEQFFKCKIMLQVIPANLRCNKLVDCEDGTDEDGCLCVDYIKNIKPKAVCDGITDCLDLSDEADCAKCNETEYLCRRSNKCISTFKRCDKIIDCDNKEDEWDCVALTDGRTLRLDGDLRPELSVSGVITVNRGGVWRPMCDEVKEEDVPRAATSACNSLGFEEYTSFHKYRVEDRELEVVFEGFNATKRVEDGERNTETCSTVYVRCSNVTLDAGVHARRLDGDGAADVELYASPSNAAVYVAGSYRCVGTVLDSRWIVTSVNCSKGITMLENQHVVVLVGKGKASLKVAGPHEETLRIVESVPIGTDVVLLKTERNITFNRYTRPAHFIIRRDKLRQEKCVATGIENGKATFVFLNPVKKCANGNRCFESKKMENCKDTSPWSGTIICDSGNGWYPAAVFYEQKGRCGLGLVNNYTSLLHYRNKILKTIRESNGCTEAPPCDGFSCKLGNCINKNKTCDGIPDCRNAEDESVELCYEREQRCHLTDNCSCPRSHLKCSNNKCIPKSAFCDRNNDCGDFGDEPDVCSCAAYLKLTNPEKICDGVLHCKDRTDEDPRVCECKPQHFKCSESKLCVPRKMVCDGFRDCPDGEDEKDCTSLKSETGDRSNVGEVMTQTAGQWHPGCHGMNYTTAQLEEICRELGFEGGSASQLSPPRGAGNVTSARPVFDNFDVVWFRRGSDNNFKLQIRSGNRPYVTLEPNKKCFRLFIACL